MLSRSNYSQKQAIESTLKDRISIIEGPLGTGKTTTILSIIANLVVRGKHVAVISKNNSAIDNIKEEPDRLKFPPFYIRFGNKEVMDQLKNTIKMLVQETAEQMKNPNAHGTILFDLVQLPLADLITDKAYLDANLEIKRFVLHKNTHIDFTLYNAINNPILAIELDGKSHQKEGQMKHDAKKDAALRHMDIPLWLLPSKSALTQEDFEEQLESRTLI